MVKRLQYISSTLLLILSLLICYDAFILGTRYIEVEFSVQVVLGDNEIVSTVEIHPVNYTGRSYGYQYLSTGDESTAIGISALESNTTGTSSTAIGYGALRNSTTGNDNVAVGNGDLAGWSSALAAGR